MEQTVVTWLINELIQNKLMALRYDADNVFNEIIAKAEQIEKEQRLNTDTVTRFEVIDHTKEKLGRILTKYGVNVELSFQDDNKTLKVFLTDK